MATAKAVKKMMLLEGDAPQREALNLTEGMPDGNITSPLPGTSLFSQIKDSQPDCLFIDGDLPDEAAFQAMADVRNNPEMEATKVVLLTADVSEAGRNKAYAHGADAVMLKPYTLDDLLDTEQTLDRFRVSFWGTRGTLPVPGERSLKYGGNTSCVSIQIGRDRHFIFDAGTGLRNFSRDIMATTGGRFSGSIFISHPHWDHFNCLPFFAPFYIPGNRIRLYGPAQGKSTLRNLIDAQMNGVFFPITVEEFRADVEFHDVAEGEHRFDGVRIISKRLRHPGHCLAYKVEHAGRTVAYVTDNELGDLAEDDPYIQEMVEYLKGVDVLIHDTTYFDDEYPSKVNWGHSSIGQVVRLAHAADVDRLYLFHHDPEHADQDIDRKLQVARALVTELGSRVDCVIAIEGETYELGVSRLASQRLG
jgi:phosphoribosyl 1,2-cyclic phosphodiesterase/CheY-like chemotaxis protein